MAREARLAVTQSYHGPDGSVLYDVGYEFPLNAELPDGITATPVVYEKPDRAARATEKPAKPASA